MNDDDFLAEVREVFNEESAELLEEFEALLLKLEDDSDNDELINELFRTVHTIKGSSGIIGYDDVVSFTHVAESVMGRLRDKELSLDETLLSLFLDCCDQVKLLIRQAIDAPGESLAADIVANGDRLLIQLQQYLDIDVDQNQLVAGDETEVDTTQGDAADASQVSNDYWHISLRLDADLFKNGLDPLYFFNYLTSAGEIVNMTTLSAELPALDEMNPEACYLGFEIDLDSAASKDKIAAVFDFMRGECALHILPPRSKIADYMVLIDALPEENLAIGEILVTTGALTRDELSEALQSQVDQTISETIYDSDNSPVEVISKPQLGSVLVEKGMTDTKVVDAAVQKQTRIKETNQAEQQSVRVNSGKLGALINLVGELVISSAHTELKAKQAGQAELLEATEHLIRLIEEIRDTTLGLRMVQIGDTFNRYKRVVRDTSKELGKKIDLTISGSETELDKTVVEKISDPLMHLIRNALDHGVEPPAYRAEQGKPETASVHLAAFHDSGSIVIEISDDGYGLDPDKLLAKAIANGIVTSDQQLTQSEIYRLIFAPGFSTAEAVTNISGRGVGLDVVNKNIDALRGQVLVESKLGVGTKFIIRLPLTLAIIDGFQVQVGKSAYVIPLDLVDECIELDGQHSMTKKGEYVDLRGEVMPYVHLADVFSEDGQNDQDICRNNIVVVHYAGQKTGLVVDELLGEHQTVIKPLGQVFRNLKGISGATILGSGEVAMIIDVPALVDRASTNSQNLNRLN